MSRNFSTSRIPRPRELRRVRLCLFVVTVGHKVGIIQGIRELDIMKQLTAPGLSLKQFSTWEAAENYYTREYNAGRVVLVNPGNLLTPPSIIETSIKIPTVDAAPAVTTTTVETAPAAVVTGNGTKNNPIAIFTPQKRRRTSSPGRAEEKSTSLANTRIVQNPRTGRLTLVREDSEEGDVYRINTPPQPEASGSGCGSAGATENIGAHQVLMGILSDMETDNGAASNTANASTSAAEALDQSAEAMGVVDMPDSESASEAEE